jgi:nucleotidyltransferase substrate binding protein (TIGR01987 family)
MALDLTSLQKAVESLERALHVARAEDMGRDTRETVRAGTIKNFEVAYEYCWKYIQRWLRLNVAAEQAEFPRTRKELFRLAAQYGLIKDPVPWYSYGDARNLSSHTYNEEMAGEVFETAVKFAEDARYLLERLREHND